MTQVNRITGGTQEFISLIKRLEGRVSSLETQGTGPIFVSDQIITANPITGVETIFGALPNGDYGLQQWVNDTEPPAPPSPPVVSGARAIYEITWDGLDHTGNTQPVDYDRTVVQMATSLSGSIWIEVGYFTAAGRVVVANQTYGEERHFRLVSYDKSGNASDPSVSTSATLVSFMESPEMTTYINNMETSVSNAESAASTAQQVAADAAEVAANAEKIAQAASSSATSLVKNGSFEFDFESWTKENSNGSITSSTAYEGTKSWEISSAGSGIYQEPIPVTEGDIFVYEMYYKTIAGFAGSGGLRLQTSTDGTTFTNTVNGVCTENVDWVNQSVEYTVPAGVTHIRARIAFSNGTTMGVWVDSVKLTNVTAMRKLQKTADDAKAIAEAAAQDAEDAAREAGNALDAANGKNTVWRQPEEPAGTSHKVNDIWFDTDDENKIHLWNGSIWESSRDSAIDRALSDAYDAEQAAAQAAEAASTATGTANSAAEVASGASTKADDAFTAANGKNKITPSFDAAPTPYEGAPGDMWWQKSTTAPYEIIKQSTWNGASWEVQTLGNNTISNLNASKLNAGTIAAARIGSKTITAEKMATDTITAESGVIASIDASKITVGELEGARVKAGTLLADRLVVGSGDNLITNPEFTSGSALTNARLAGSTAGATWTTPDYIGWNKTTASATVHSLKLGGQASDVTRPVTPVIANRRYKINWTVYADAIASTGTRIAYRWLSRTGTITTSTGTTQALKATGLTSYEEEVVVPADITHVCIDLEFTRHPGGGWLDFRQPSMQLMTDGTVITEDAVLAKHIKAGEITGDVLDMTYVRGQVITGTMFEGQTFTGGTFRQATFETSPLSATGIKMSPTLGLIGYNANQQPVFQVDPSGNATFTGQVNVTGGTIPQSTVTDLVDTLADHQGAADTVWSWANPADRTLIDGGHIATNSITANQIALGAGQNFIPGGQGGDTRGWEDFQIITPGAGWDTSVQHIYMLTGKKLAYSPSFAVSGLNKYSFSYQYVGDRINMFHELSLAFYDINGSYISMEKLGRKSVSSPWTFGSGTLSNKTAPSGAVTARVYIEHNWLEGDTLGTTQFGNLRMTTGVQTMLTASGLSSYNSGTQTVRINGEDNLLIGEFITGRPGVEPYMKMKSNSSVASVDFFGVPGGVYNHGAIWYNQGALATDAGGGTWGYLSMFAIDDSKTLGSREYYAAGIELRANQKITFKGKLDIESDMIKSGAVTWGTQEFGPSSTAEYEIVYPRAFSSDTDYGQLSVQLTMVSGNGAPMIAVVTFRDNTKFRYRVRNLSSTMSSGVVRMAWMVIRNV